VLKDGTTKAILKACQGFAFWFKGWVGGLIGFDEWLLSFFLSLVCKTQANHWTQRFVITNNIQKKYLGAAQEWANRTPNATN